MFTTGDSVVSGRKRALYHRPAWPPTPGDEVNHVAWALGEVARGVFDVVHMNSPLGVPFSAFVRVPFVYTLHHKREESFSRIFAAHPDTFYVAISRRQLELEVPLPRSRVIHHGLSPNRYPPSQRDEGYLAHLGRYAEEKGTHLALDVARLAGLPIRIAGRTHPVDEAYFEACRRASARGGGRAPTRARPTTRTRSTCLRGARALLCPLQWEEPFGLVAIEAMLCGTPVLGFPRGSFPEIVEEGVTGFLAEPGDVDAIAPRRGRARRASTARVARAARASASARPR